MFGKAISIFVVATAAISLAQPRIGTSASRAIAPLSGKAFEIAWMSQVMQYSQTAILMINDIVKYGKEPQIANAVKQSTGIMLQDGMQMLVWIKSWYDSKPNFAQMRLVAQDMAELVKITTGRTVAGRDVNMNSNPDRKFLEGMILHHQVVINSAKFALKKVVHSELKILTQRIISSQNQEINQFKAWLKDVAP